MIWSIVFCLFAFYAHKIVWILTFPLKEPLKFRCFFFWQYCMLLKSSWSKFLEIKVVSIEMVPEGLGVWIGQSFFFCYKCINILIWRNTVSNITTSGLSPSITIHFIPCIFLAHNFAIRVAALWQRMVCMGVERRRHQGVAWSTETVYLLIWNLLIITGGAQLVLWGLCSFWSLIRACMPLSHRFFFIS